MTSTKIHSIAVIGGGAAGIMAVLRGVLNNDDVIFFPGSAKNQKKSRAKWVTKIENMPGYFHYKKGIEDPAKETLSWIESSSFASRLAHKKGRGITSLIKESNETFSLEDDKGEKYTAKYVILCTGIMDVQPKIGDSINAILPYANVQLVDYCLRCDGHHVLGKEVVVIGNGEGAAWVAIMLHERYGAPISILSHGAAWNVAEELGKILALYNIKVFEEEIASFKGDPKMKTLEGAILSSGKAVNFQIAFVSMGIIAYNKLALDVGAELDERGLVKVDAKGESSQKGLFVAGDLRANAKKQIYTAWDHAVDSLDYINAQIRKGRREILMAEKADQNPGINI